MMDDNRYQEFLLEHPIETLWIFEATFEWSTKGSHWTIWFEIDCNTAGVCIHQSAKSNVWSTSGGLPGIRTVGKAIKCKRIHPNKCDTRPVDACQETDTVHVSGGWFWGQIFFDWECNALHVSSEWILHHFQGLGGINMSAWCWIGIMTAKQCTSQCQDMRRNC